MTYLAIPCYAFKLGFPISQSNPVWSFSFKSCTCFDPVRWEGNLCYVCAAARGKEREMCAVRCGRTRRGTMHKATSWLAVWCTFALHPPTPTRVTCADSLIFQTSCGRHLRTEHCVIDRTYCACCSTQVSKTAKKLLIAIKFCC